MARVLGLDVQFQVMDAEKTDFAEDSFDALVTRNLTWTLPHVGEAYREWFRILKPGGVLINFDADYCAASGEEEEIARNYLPVGGSVASPRLDAVIALVFRLSRGKVTPYIEGGKVFCDGRQVLSVLPEREVYKDLVLDIGTLETVDYVLINGIKTDNYTVEGRLLTIPAPVIPGNLTIGMKNENGKITVRTYSVTYTPGEGYSAKRLYGNSDALGFFLRPFRLIASLFRLIIEKLSSGN